MSHPTISLCMIVKNEEKHLETCLQSVQGVVDEIIIVDTGSTDATVEIAERFHAKVSYFEWIGDFAAARNYALEKATSDYILVLDADEHFEADDAKLLRQDIASDRDFYMLRFINYLNTGNTHHLAIRLFKNNRGLKYRGRIHEHINIENFTDYTNEVATPLVHHVGYGYDVYLEKNKHERNFTLLKQAVAENPTGYNYFNLGRQYKASGEFQFAFDAFKEAFPKSKHSTYITTLLNSMVQCLYHLGKYPEGLRLALDALDGYSKYTDLHFTLGELYQASNYWPDAERAFKRCLELGELQFEETYAGVGSYLAYAKLAELYFTQGKRIEAVDAAIRALQIEKKCDAAMEVFLRATAAAKLSLDEIELQLQRACPLATGEEVLKRITVLYMLRHPLLLRYIETYNLKVESVLRAIAYQLSGRFADAKACWDEIQDPIRVDHAPDVLLLSIQLQDEALFARCKSPLNLSQKEAKLLRKLVHGEAVTDDSIPDTVAKLLYKMCTQTLQTQQFDTFEYLSGWLLKSATNYQLDLAGFLYRNGYAEVAVDLLLLLQQGPPHAEVYGLLGDICLQQKQWPEALHMFVRLFDLNKDYSTFYRLYTVYAAMGDEQGMQKIKRQMQERFPLSEWVKTI